MSNTLDDRLKNEYSTKYVLVTDKRPYYPDVALAAPSSVQEKIQQSSVEGIAGSKLDPIRQSSGRFYTFKSAQTEAANVNFYNTIAPNFPNIPGVGVYTTENVTDQWANFFGTGAHKDTLNLSRKATRIKVELGTDDLLENRLTTLSFVSDIFKKNQTKAYDLLGGTAISPDDDPQVIQLATQLIYLKNDLEKAKEKLSSAKTLKELIDSQSGYADVDIIQDPIYLELLNKWEEYLEGYNQGLFGAPLLFAEWLAAQIPIYEGIVQDLEFQVQNGEAALANAQGDAQGNLTSEDYAYISFKDKGTDYNYDSILTKNDLNMAYANWGNVSLTELESSVQEVFVNEWENFSLKALKTAIFNGRLNSFYNYATEDYTHPENSMYTDSTFSMALPMSPRALSLTSDLNKNELFVDFKPTYNYYSKQYEEGTKQQNYIDFYGESKNLSERELPMIYEVPLDDDPDGTPSSDTEIDFPASKFKFEKFGHKLLNCKYNSDPLEANSCYNIILDQNSQQFLKKYDNVKSQFPFYVDIDFKSDINRDFANIFNQSGITNELIKTWISNFFHSSTISSIVAVNPDKGDPITKEGGFQGAGYYDPEDTEGSYNQILPGLFTAPICKDLIYQINSKKDFYLVVPPESSEDKILLGDNLVRETMFDYNVREFDLNLWLDGYISSLAAIADPQQSGTSPGGITYSDENWINTVIRPSEASNISKIFSSSDDNGFEQTQDQLAKILKGLAFLGKYRNLVDQKARNYDEILQKKEAYNETLFYRIQKVALNDEGNIDENGLVQNIWLVKPNVKEDESNVEIMRYIDTQIKYEQNYEYTVYAYQMVVGTRYGFQFENKFSLQQYATYSLTDKSVKMAAYQKAVQESAFNEGYGATNSDEKIYRSSETENFNSLFKKETEDPSSLNNRLAVFDVVCEPDVKLIEMPFYKKTVSISDAPPASPEVDIVPLRGRDNDIKINFYPGSISREMIPIVIKPEDYPKFGKARKAQDRALFKMAYAPLTLLGEDGMVTLSQTAEDFLSNLAGVEIDLASLDPDFYVEEKLIFKSDDFATHYEIYRLTEAPQRFGDFSNGLLTTIDALQLSSFTDKIQHNKKYYYMFRAIDVHNKVSNPSPIYQVEMVENSGAVYPVISIYEFEKSSLGSKTKAFRKRLKIDAESLQGLLNLEKSALANAGTAIASGGNQNLTLGIKEKGIFSDSKSNYVKRFKFRIRSVHTGKVIDINVGFKFREEETTEQIVSCGDEVVLGDLEQQVSGDDFGLGTDDDKMKLF